MNSSRVPGMVAKVALTAGILFCICIWFTISRCRSPLSANRSQIQILGTSTSSILCKTWCSVSAFAIRGSLRYISCRIPSVFFFLLLLVHYSLPFPPLFAPFSTSFLFYTLIITNPPTFSFSLSNSAITFHTNSFSFTCIASTNELNLVDVAVALAKWGDVSLPLLFASIAPLSPPGWRASISDPSRCA